MVVNGQVGEGLWDWLGFIRCQQCLGALGIKAEEHRGVEVWTGSLSCSRCGIDYPIVEGIAILGLSSELALERKAEIWAENDWHFCRVPADEHLRFAEVSFRVTERIIRRLGQLMPPHENCFVLDVGAGGGGQSWLFARHGYRVIAADISPENMAVARSYVEHGTYFGRLATDCSLLPFASERFDILFCKEFAHHMESLPTLLMELARLLKPNGVLVMHDPVWPIGGAGADHAREFGLHHHHYSGLDYVRALRQAGFRLVSFLNQRGPISPSRSPLLSRMDRILTELLGEQQWDGPIGYKLFRSMLLGGSITTISRWPGKESGSQSVDNGLFRRSERIDAATLSRNRTAVAESGKQVPSAARLLEEVVHEPDDRLIARINQRDVRA